MKFVHVSKIYQKDEFLSKIRVTDKFEIGSSTYTVKGVFYGYIRVSEEIDDSNGTTTVTTNIDQSFINQHYHSIYILMDEKTFDNSMSNCLHREIEIVPLFNCTFFKQCKFCKKDLGNATKEDYYKNKKT